MSSYMSNKNSEKVEKGKKTPVNETKTPKKDIFAVECN